MAESVEGRDTVSLDHIEVETVVRDTLKAVSIVFGVEESEFVTGALRGLLGPIVLNPGFAGEFRDKCDEFDASQGLEEGSTHSALAGSVMAFRSQARQ